MAGTLGTSVGKLVWGGFTEVGDRFETNGGQREVLDGAICIQKRTKNSINCETEISSNTFVKR